MTLAGNVIHPSEIIGQVHKSISHEKLNIYLTLIVSLLAGPVFFLILSGANANFAQVDRGITFFALTLMAFELTWIIYGFAAMIHKAISD